LPLTAILRLQLYTCTSKQPKNHPKAFDCSDEIGLEKIEELVAMAARKSMGVGERKRTMRELTGIAEIRPTAGAYGIARGGGGVPADSRLWVGAKPSRAVEGIVVAALD